MSHAVDSLSPDVDARTQSLAGRDAVVAPLRAPWWGWVLILSGVLVLITALALIASRDSAVQDAPAPDALVVRLAFEDKAAIRQWKWTVLVHEQPYPGASWVGRVPTSVIGKVSLLLAFSLIALGLRLRQRPASQSLAYDRRAPVLYLRAFRDDSSPHGYEVRTIETRLVALLQRLGPVIAVGRPSEPIGQLGAARLYLPDPQWAEIVARLMANARVVVLRVSYTAGVLRELEIARRTIEPERLVLCVPAGDLSEAGRIVVEEALGVNLPERLRGHTLIRFGEGWVPLPVGPADWEGVVPPSRKRVRASVDRELTALLASPPPPAKEGTHEAVLRLARTLEAIEVPSARIALSWMVLVPVFLALAAAIALRPSAALLPTHILLIRRIPEFAAGLLLPLAAAFAAWLWRPRSRALPTAAAAAVLLVHGCVLLARYDAGTSLRVHQRETVQALAWDLDGLKRDFWPAQQAERRLVAIQDELENPASWQTAECPVRLLQRARSLRHLLDARARRVDSIVANPVYRSLVAPGRMEEDTGFQRAMGLQGAWADSLQAALRMLEGPAGTWRVSASGRVGPAASGPAARYAALMARTREMQREWRARPAHWTDGLTSISPRLPVVARECASDPTSG